MKLDGKYGINLCENKEEVFNKLARIVDSNFGILWEDEIKNSLNKYQEDNIINRSVKLYGR